MKLIEPHPNFADRLVGWFAPARLAQRMFARGLLRLNGWNGATRTRLERDSSNPLRYGRPSDDLKSSDLAEKATALVGKNPAAEGLIERLAEGIVSEEISMIAQTSDPDWNRAHSELWDFWAESLCDARNLDTFTGLVYHIVRGLLVHGRIGVLLLKTGKLQLIESWRFRTPPDKLFDPLFVNGVELDQLGRPVAYYVLENPDGGLVTTNVIRIPEDDMVYFALRRAYSDTSGKTRLGESFDNFEQIDATIEAVTTAAQVAACFGIVFKGTNPGTLQNITKPVTDSKGQPTRGFNLEPATAKFLSDYETMEQIKPEHPSQNLSEFLREVLRFASLPTGVPLELMTMNFTAINYSGARSMNLFFDRVCRVFRSRVLYRGLRRIYRWRTSKWIKAGDLPEPGLREAWKCRIQHAGLPWVDPVADADADQILADRGWISDAEVIRRRGGDPAKVVQEIADGLKDREGAGIERVWSTKTRHMTEQRVKE